ncbi:MAG: hypothetical protein JRF36_13420 [Deltaproteobacteria bacterium]|nr:hypothetical protein [Deltaproteobacteria bacterium]MBW2468489.1 hypothetical protein [Deltaproteobacteria bacterium]MBW2487889.1 hypothetical protein [Deltaproteobacteria bacterium]
MLQALMPPSFDWVSKPDALHPVSPATIGALRARILPLLALKSKPPAVRVVVDSELFMICGINGQLSDRWCH